MSKKATKKIDEESAMAAGAVEGAPTKDYFIDREEFLKELQLRESIRKIIFSSKRKHRLLQEKQEKTLRKVIRKLISEVDTDTTPHASTAINFLEDLLKKILPTIEQDYKSLTTKKEQRDSFRSQFVSSVESELSTLDLNMAASKEGGEVIDAEQFIDIEEEIEVDITDEDKFIDIDGEKEATEETAAETIEIEEPELDTGSKLAAQTYDAVEKQITETYSTLSDEEDQRTFEDYLITNLKLYFDKWEKELSDVIEPTTDEYEKEKDNMDADMGDAEGAGEGDEEGLEL